MSKVVLVVAAHTDDEVLGCGGTIARHVAEGDEVCVAFMADGVSSRLSATSAEHELRSAAAEGARKILGMHKNFYLNFPDNRLDSIPLLDIVRKLELVINEIQPEIVYTHHCGDLNIDHRITSQAVMTACRPVPESSIREIYAFEIMSSTEWNHSASCSFIPNTFVNISDYWGRKQKALEAYQLEMRPTPHSRSIEHLKSLAEHRGYSVGVRCAESFVLVKKIY